MSKRGLPMGVQMRHDTHYVDALSAPSKTIGRRISIDLIEPNLDQPRSEFGDLTDLTASILEKGVLEPLLVKPIPATGKWLIIAGERRWRASKAAGLTEVPCIEMDLDEQGVAEIALIENLQRKDLNLWEEADGLAALAARYGYTQEQIAKKISKSRSSVTELMTIAGLPGDIRTKCSEAGISSKTALLEVARQFDEAAMYAYIDSQIGIKNADNGKTKSSQNKKVSVVGQKKEAIVKVGDDSFEFVGSGYKIILSFTDAQPISKTRILKTLKSVFDQVKAESDE